MFRVIVTVLELVGRAPAQGWGGDTARRLFIGGGRGPLLYNSVPPSSTRDLADKDTSELVVQPLQWICNVYRCT